MDGDQRDGQLHGLAGKGVDAHQLPEEQQDRSVGKPHGNVSPQQQLAGVVNGLLVVACTDAAPHHRDHGQTDGLARDDAHAVQIVCHCVGCDLHRAEGGDHAHHQNAPGLEQAVFKGRGDTDAQNALCHAAVQPQGLGHGKHRILPVALAQDQRRSHHAGHHAGPCYAVHAHFKAEDAHRVAHDVDDVHQKADLHGDLGVADAAEQCRAAVVQRQKRVAEGDDLQILHARVQHVGINRAVEQPDQRAGQHKAYHADHHTGQAAEQQQLTGAFVGIPALFCAQILAYHHRAAGSQRRKQHDDKVIDHIHQTDAGDGRLAAAGHHHGVGHTHRHFQQLLHQQRDGQYQQFLLAEQRLPPTGQAAFFIAMQ